MMDLCTQESVIRNNGYPFEIHNVTTADGHILTVYRIPSGRAVKNKKDDEKRSKKKKIPILIKHGFMCDVRSWLMMGPNLGFGKTNDGKHLIELCARSVT